MGPEDAWLPAWRPQADERIGRGNRPSLIEQLGSFADPLTVHGISAAWLRAGPARKCRRSSCQGAGIVRLL